MPADDDISVKRLLALMGAKTHITNPKDLPLWRDTARLMMPAIRRDDALQVASQNDVDPLIHHKDWEMYYAGPDFAPLFSELARTFDWSDWEQTLKEVINHLGRRGQGVLFMGFDIRNRPWLPLDYTEYHRASPWFVMDEKDGAVFDPENSKLSIQAEAVALGWYHGPDGHLRVATTAWLNNGLVRTGVANSMTVRVAALLAWIMVNPEPNLVEVVEQKAGAGLPPAVKREMGRRANQMVKVVNLRQQVRRNISEVREARQHALSHRFIVRGHWRKQAFGPGRSERKLIYIAPFLKGPADAPFVERETVYKW